MNVSKLVRKFNDPVLKQVCEALAEGDDRKFIETMLLVVRKHRDPNAAGLAAPQIGVAKRVIVTNCMGRNGMIRRRVMINPVIVERSTETNVQSEGCLSYPGRSKRVRRHAVITVLWLDERWVAHEEAFADFEARVIQHEVDHLDGICRVGDDSLNDEEPTAGSAALMGAVIAVSALAMGGMGGRR